MKYKFSYIFNSLLFLIIGLSSCEENKFDIDLNGQTADVNWLHLETDFTGLVTHSDFDSYNDSLLKVYGNFYRLYTGRVMKFGNISTPVFKERAVRFLVHKDIHQLYRTVDSNFHDISPIKTDVEKAFCYYQYYFPDKEIPVVVSMVTGISNNIVVTDSVLGVGLDLYLGDSNRIYQLAGIPEYIRKKSTPDYMVYDMLRGWVLSEFEPENKKDDVLSQIVNYGKSIYLMDALFPFAPDHYKIGFTADEIKWCKENESTIWAKMIEEQQLYSTDVNVIRALTGPGPFSPGFPKESPAQIGYWMGWQIVRKYMDEHPETTIKELMKIEDAQSLLRHSKYKPR